MLKHKANKFLVSLIIVPLIYWRLSAHCLSDCCCDRKDNSPKLSTLQNGCLSPTQNNIESCAESSVTNSFQRRTIQIVGSKINAKWNVEKLSNELFLDFGSCRWQLRAKSSKICLYTGGFLAVTIDVRFISEVNLLPSFRERTREPLHKYGGKISKLNRASLAV